MRPPAPAPRVRRHRVGGRRLLVRSLAVVALLMWGLGACLPGLEGRFGGSLPDAYPNGGRLVASGAGLELRALTGAAAEGMIALRNHGSTTIDAALTTTDPLLGVALSSLRLPPRGEQQVAVTARCGSEPAVHRAWVVIDSQRGSEALDVRLVCDGSDLQRVAAAAAGRPLHWEPPRLSDPQVVRVRQEGGPSELRLATGRDYLVLMPDQPLRRGFTIRGGRNVVLIGGEIVIPHRGANPSVAARRALHIVDSTGTVHVEGVLMHGEDISEGIQINAPEAVVQIQNVGIFGIRARDQEHFSDNHPDLIQSYGNAREIRVDRFSGSTDYQGFFFVADYHGPAHGPVLLRHVHIVGDPTARYLLWFSPHPDAGDVELHEVYLDVHPERSGGLGRSVWPDAHGDGIERARLDEDAGVVTWPQDMRPQVRGEVRAGAPPEGTFVRAEHIGLGYRSPGYALPARD